MSSPALLSVDNIETCYGVSKVLFGMTLAVAPREMVTLMGRNGMGKTTTVRSIMGLSPAMAGDIRFDGTAIRELPAYRIAQLTSDIANDLGSGYRRVPILGKLGAPANHC